jgi:hypothetical protein
MAKFEKGNKLSKGRPPGAINRSTEMMKLSIARATNRVLDQLPTIMEEMVKKDPKGAVDLALKMLEFHMPKMSRIEMKAEVEQRIQQISVNINQKTVNEPGSQHNNIV